MDQNERAKLIRNTAARVRIAANGLDGADEVNLHGGKYEPTVDQLAAVENLLSDAVQAIRLIISESRKVARNG